MIRIIAVDVFAFISAVDDTEIRRIAGTAVGDAGTFDTNLTAGTHRSLLGIAFCTAELVVRLGIDASDGIGRRSRTDIHKSCSTFIDAGTAGTACGIGIGNRVIGTFIVACTAMVCIIALDILAAVLTVDDAKVGCFCIFGAVILKTLTFDTDGTAGTYGSGGCGIRCTAVIVVRHRIDALDGIGRCTGADIYKTGCAGIYAGSIGAALGVCIGNRMFGAFIVTCAAVIGIIAVCIFTYVGTMNDAEVWRIAAAGILNAAAADANRTAFADFAKILGICSTAIGIVGHRINTFNGSD